MDYFTLLFPSSPLSVHKVHLDGRLRVPCLSLVSFPLSSDDLVHIFTHCDQNDVTRFKKPKQTKNKHPVSRTCKWNTSNVFKCRRNINQYFLLLVFQIGIFQIDSNYNCFPLKGARAVGSKLCQGAPGHSNKYTVAMDVLFLRKTAQPLLDTMWTTVLTSSTTLRLMKSCLSKAGFLVVDMMKPVPLKTAVR